MPKEQPCLREQSPGATSSKNAKDKNNSLTMQAIRDSKVDADDSSGRGSRCSSEKDSGYSDGSDWQQTDVEDQSRVREHAEPPQQSQNQKLGHGNTGNPTFMSSGRELSPIYIIKNMADMIQKRGQLLWRNGSREISSSGASHMILLPQASLLPAATVQLHKPVSLNSVREKKMKATYLPILNSYPRIAPHPSKKLPDKSLMTEESQNPGKRVCTEQKISHTPVPGSLPDQHLFKQPKFSVSASVQPCSSSTKDSQSSSSSTASSSCQMNQSPSNLHSTSSLLTTRRLHRNVTTSSRHRRFLNTVEILRQSGLLDITLHTKELLRQSNATDRDIAELRQHTELLCQAAGSQLPDSITPWEKLYRAMVESGNYPSLPNLQTPAHPDSASQLKSICIAETSRAGAGNSDASPTHLFTSIPDPNQNCPVPQQPRPKQGREFDASDKFSEKVTFMPPDSSTD